MTKTRENTVDKSILSLINNKNKDVAFENSNKNAEILCTQRDLIAGETSKYLMKNYILPKDVVENHENGVYHYHDMDFSMQPMLNCFSGDTKFITNLGVLRFNQCNNGQKVKVLNKNGIWKDATVKKYGKQKLQTITITSGRTKKNIRATKNHRWLLKDGTITTDLKVGDKLHLLQETEIDVLNNDMFCFGFVLGDGSEYNLGETSSLRVRLCGEKTMLLNKFLDAGYIVSKYKENGSDDIFLSRATRLSKNDFLENKIWRYLSKEDKVSLFLGYYAADGFKDRNGIATSSEHLGLMIREISALAGYHITSEKFELRNTNYKTNAQLYTFMFMKKQNSNRNWIVKEINTEDKHLYDVWCVEEPETKSFTLDGGVVTGNCCLINIEDMLDNGTIMNGRLYETPQTFEKACGITAQIIAQITSNQYGGNSINIKHLAKYLVESEINIYKEELEIIVRYGIKTNKEILNKRVKKKLKKVVRSGIRSLLWQINGFATLSGQSPFTTLFLEVEKDSDFEDYQAMIVEEVIKQRLEGMKNENGVTISPAFPKLIFVLDENNMHPNSKYYYLKQKSIECSSKRLVPDYISAKKMRELYDGNVFSPMGCRSKLSVWYNKEGKPQFEGRFNMGVVSLNLVQIAIIANGDEEIFWKLLDKRLESCKEALMFRYNWLKGTKSDVSPIHFQSGALARLKKGETIDSLLEDGYATISLGYIGIYEMTKLMKGVSHTHSKGKRFALRVMKKLNKATKKWKEETGLGFGLYGTPSEGLCNRFCKIDKEQFGSIENITDKGWYTNSFHVDVREEIDAFEKLRFESQFQSLSSGGYISYIEVPNMSRNLEALEQVIDFGYENTVYFEINTKSDYCYDCGFDGEMLLNDEYNWFCPNCDNTNKDKLHIVRRTCGYLGEQYWNEGKTKEIKQRVCHL